MTLLSGWLSSDWVRRCLVLSLAAWPTVSGVAAFAAVGGGAAADLAKPIDTAAAVPTSTSTCQTPGLQPQILGRSDLAAFHLAVCDDFSGEQLDTRLWSYNFTWGDARQIVGTTTEFNFNAAFDPALVSEKGGTLVLSAANHPAASAIDHHPDGTTSVHRMPDNFCWQLKGGNADACRLDYSAGAVTSRFKFRYGYLEGRFRLPDTHGFWPAFWLLNGGWPPETDIFELLTNKSADGTARYYLSQTYHYANPGGGNGASGRTFNPGDLAWLGLCSKRHCTDHGELLTSTFHTFGVEWSPQAINFYVDGQLTHSFNDATRITAQPAYVLINLGVGGWADNPDARTDWTKAHMEVDWVRLWTLPGGIGQAMMPD